jgi:biofilm PGA synthesis N-glycosyltransferase PgaC
MDRCPKAFDMPESGKSLFDMPPSDMSRLPSYVLITPARNEAQLIPYTLDSVVAQTLRPAKWVIVSDGATDGTDEIVQRYAAQHDWIKLARIPEGARRSFAGKVNAFNAGYAELGGVHYDIIGNLDADISFDSEYLAFLMSKFAENPRLGVAGTPYRENNPSHDVQLMSPTHVSGACQLFRRECFEQIGGYQPVSSGGIDLIALLGAQARGWQTWRFDERSCFHHRNVGSENHSGIVRRLLNRGRKDYQLGGHPGFEIFRAAYQMRSKPYVVGGMLMLAGYAWSVLTGVKRTMPEELMAIRQREQVQRLKDVLRHPFRRGSGQSPAAVRS